MSIQSEKDLQGMSYASQVVGETLKKMCDHAEPGMSTLELDAYGYQILQSYGAHPAPKQMYNFPGWTCISVNDAAAHGIPSDQIVLQEGDLVNIDVSAEVNGYYGDNGASFVLGRDVHGHNPLVEASKNILHAAISKIRGGVKIAQLGAFIENEAQKLGYTTIKNLVGHGIGHKLHEAPFELPNFHDRFNKDRFKQNTVVALETFISTKGRFTYEAPDGWTMKVKGGGYVAQHEHTLIVTDKQPVILTGNNGF